MAYRNMGDAGQLALVEEIIKLCKDRQNDTHHLRKYEDTLKKAARIMHDPAGWRNIETDDTGRFTVVETFDLEREELEIEAYRQSRPFWQKWFRRADPSQVSPEEGQSPKVRSVGFWQMPKDLRITIITLCMAAVVQGWVQAMANGANLTWPVGTGLDVQKDSPCDPHGNNAWVFAIVNAAPWFSASIFALFITDPATEILFGRRAAIIMAGSFTLAASIGGALVNTWYQLLACRILLGLGMGCKASVVPVFAAEVAPNRIRGALVMNWQLFDALGIFLGFTGNVIVSFLGQNSWRWMTALPVLPTLILLALAMVACPESPRFLMSRGDHWRAFEILTRLRGSRILAAKELVYTYYQTRYERDHDISTTLSRSPRSSRRNSQQSTRDTGPPKIGFLRKLTELFTKERNRNALITAVVCMVAQQLCGINVLIFFSSNIFSAASGVFCANATQESLIRPLLMSWGIGLVNFVFAFPAYFLIDSMGRRWLLITTVPVLCVLMGAAALSYVHGPHNVPLSIFAYLFTAVYAWGLGPVPFTLSAEVFPLDHRVIGMSFAVFSNFFFAGLLSLFVPAVTASSLSHAGLLGIFAALNVIAFILIIFFVRETVTAADGDNRNSMEPLALEELYKIFHLPTRDVLKHQGASVWWWRWLLETDQLDDIPLWKLWEEKHAPAREDDGHVNNHVEFATKEN